MDEIQTLKEQAVMKIDNVRKQTSALYDVYGNAKLKQAAELMDQITIELTMEIKQA